MNLTSPSQVRELAGMLGIVPNKALGQNFLIDRNILDILIDAAGLSADDSVLEVGGGLGVVTERLVDMAGRVIVIEKDRRLAEHLALQFGKRKGFRLICADAVDVLGCGAGSDDAVYGGFNKVVANLPYSAGTRILVDVIGNVKRPELIVVTVQMEVAMRFAAQAGSKDQGLLSLWSQLFYDVEIVKAVNPTCFWPKPAVKSGIMNMVLHGRRMLSADEQSYFFTLTRYVFGHRRKQLAGILKNAPDGMRTDPAVTEGRLRDLGQDARARPENLSLGEWVKLVKMMKGEGR